jgi:hypothetical protein
MNNFNVDFTALTDKAGSAVLNFFVPSFLRVPAKAFIWSAKKFGVANTVTGTVLLSVGTGAAVTGGAVYAGYKAYTAYTNWKDSQNASQDTSA